MRDSSAQLQTVNVRVAEGAATIELNRPEASQRLEPAVRRGAPGASRPSTIPEIVDTEVVQMRGMVVACAFASLLLACTADVAQASVTFPAAEVQAGNEDCGNNSGGADIGSAKLSVSKYSATKYTITYSLTKGPVGQHFVVELRRPEGIKCELVGHPENSKGIAEFTTNSKGAGKATGTLEIPSEDDGYEYVVVGHNEDTGVDSDSLLIETAERPMKSTCTTAWVGNNQDSQACAILDWNAITQTMSTHCTVDYSFGDVVTNIEDCQLQRGKGKAFEGVEASYPPGEEGTSNANETYTFSTAVSGEVTPIKGATYSANFTFYPTQANTSGLQVQLATPFTAVKP